MQSPMGSTSGYVSDAQFQSFVDDVLREAFPRGFTLVDANGQFTTRLERVQERVIVLVAFAPVFNDTFAQVDRVRTLYRDRFHQRHVVFSWQRTNVCFGDICMPNEANVECTISHTVASVFVESTWRRTEFYFGLSISCTSGAMTGHVSASQFDAFVDNVVAPLFPSDGLSYFNISGQYRSDVTGTLSISIHYYISKLSTKN
jgi:hypothetical protein